MLMFLNYHNIFLNLNVVITFKNTGDLLSRWGQEDQNHFGRVPDLAVDT